jgi:hypothetical protein
MEANPYWESLSSPASIYRLIQKPLTKRIPGLLINFPSPGHCGSSCGYPSAYHILIIAILSRIGRRLIGSSFHRYFASG